MYPPSSSSSSSSSSTTSSSSQATMPSGGLTRYGSAPGSLLTSAVDSIINLNNNNNFHDLSSLVDRPHPHHHHPHQYHNESTCQQVNTSEDTNQNNNKDCMLGGAAAGGGLHLHRSYGLNQLGGSTTSSSPLLRQKSSPAGFLSHLVSSDNGFSITRGSGSYGSQGGSHGVTRLNSQLSFTRQDSLSHISEVSENGDDGINSESSRHTSKHPYTTSSFGIDAWENGNSIVFSSPSGKRAKTMDEDVFNCLNALESQFSMPQTTLEMATMETLLNVPEDAVPCKIRAKRGCATHPRSIAERERRTRISGKLKKLQDLVPNMDKQTCYADMLDLAVEHIKGLQNEIQTLHKDLENCNCGCKPNT